MTRVKIGHLIHWDGPGGGPQAVINLARGFQQRGFEQVVIGGGRGRLAQFCAQAGIEWREVPIHHKATLIWGFCRLVRVLKQVHPDILFVQGQWAGPVGALAAKWAGVPTVYIAQWPSFYTDWTPWRAFRNAWAEWIPCRLARWVVALTPSTHYQYLCRGWAPEAKLRMIPNLFSPEEIPTPEEIRETRARLGWTAEHVHVVSVGRLADQKRVDWLVRAWQRVAERCPQARLWIVGDGPEEAALKRLADELKLDASCRFLGAQPRGIAYLACADLVVMTSMYEACSFVPLEAMACGRPIVLTAADGARDHVTDGREGRLVAPGDIAGLAEAVIELVENPARRESLGAAGRQHLARLMSEPVLDRYVELIEQSCGGAPTEPVSGPGPA